MSFLHLLVKMRLVQFCGIKRSSVCGLKFGGGVVFSQICSVASVYVSSQTNNGLLGSKEELLKRSSSLVFKGFENWSKSFVKPAAAFDCWQKSDGNFRSIPKCQMAQSSFGQMEISI